MSRALRPRGDDGLSLTEMVVTLFILSIFMAMTGLIVVRVVGESAGQRDTLQGLQQAQFAEVTFGQYLRSTTAIDYISSNGDDFVFTAAVGTTTTLDDAVNASYETAEAELCPTGLAKVDSLEIIFGINVTVYPHGLNECLAGPSPPRSIPSGVRLTEAFYIVPPSQPIFSFYTLGSQVSSNAPALDAMTLSAAIASPTSVQAVGFEATFLPPPGPSEGNGTAELGTEAETVAFLRDKERFAAN